MTRDAWLRPGAFEEVPGVHRVPLPLPNDGLRAVNVYVLRHDERVELIDGGWAIAEGEAALAAALQKLDHGPADIRRIFVTHVHRDHYSQASVLRSRYGTRIALGHRERASLAAMRQPERRAFATQLELLRAAGADDLVEHFTAVAASAPELDPVLHQDPDVWLLEGATEVAGRRMEVIETPGHTQGHVVFRDPEAGLLFAGDHVLPTITPSIGFEPVRGADPLGDFLGSLARLRALPDAILLPAHGPVVSSVHRRIDELVAHHGRRLDQTETAVERGAATAAEVAEALRWTRRERAFADLDPYNRMLAVIETDAHLRLLHAQGRLANEDADGVVHYCCHVPAAHRSSPTGEATSTERTTPS